MAGQATAKRQAEFTEFVNASAGYLTRTAFLLCGDAELANDLVQEALTRTYAAWWRVRPEDARGYARRVLVNLSVDRWRRRGPESVELTEFAASGSAEAGVDDRDEIVRLLRTLSPHQRRVIVLRYFDDLTEPEVARTLGVSVGTVKSACSRGLAILREQLAPIKEGER